MNWPTITINASLAELIAAIGTVASVAVTAIIALLGYLRGVTLRSEAARNNVLLAAGIAIRTLRSLQSIPSLRPSNDDYTSVRYAAHHFIDSAAWLELVEAIAELVPKDLPDARTAESYTHVRSIVRSVGKMMRNIAELPPIAGGTLGWPDFGGYLPGLLREGQLLLDVADELKHPFQPRWLRHLLRPRPDLTEG